jgi:UDP-3-O-[3-hydroxymyristoyl] N-acetylglucosamine deacetylase
MRQRTLKAPIDCSGVGLHSGAAIAMKLRPADPDTGILFRRIDLKNGARDIPARFDAVCDTRLCTTLSNDHGTRLGTVEHLMAALHGCGIDNAVIELDGPEVPIMDGSSEPFVFLIECAGTVEQAAPRRTVLVRRPVVVEENGARAALEPAEGFTISLDIEFASRAIGRQELFLEVSRDSFRNQICRARTFGFLHEVEALRAAGLARGGSLENAVVVDGDTVLNDDGLRYEDEFVRHKVLDCIGDMALAGHAVTGHLRARRTGHGLNNRLLRALFADEANYAIVPVDELAAATV